MIGTLPMVEMAMVERLGSITLAQGTQNNHAVVDPVRFVDDADPLVIATADEDDDLPPLHSGFEVVRSSTDRGSIYRTRCRTSRIEYGNCRLGMFQEVSRSNGNANAARDSEYLNKALASRGPK